MIGTCCACKKIANRVDANGLPLVLPNRCKCPAACVEDVENGGWTAGDIPLGAAEPDCAMCVNEPGLFPYVDLAQDCPDDKMSYTEEPDNQQQLLQKPKTKTKTKTDDLLSLM